MFHVGYVVILVDEDDLLVPSYSVVADDASLMAAEV